MTFLIDRGCLKVPDTLEHFGLGWLECRNDRAVLFEAF
jgi:hypothetical protein